MRFLFLIDPFERLSLDGDTTYALMLECAARGHEVWTCQPGHLSLEHDDVVADAQHTEVRDAATPAEAFTTGDRRPTPLETFDAVLLRQDPPLDVEYLHTTWLLERARGKTVFVNDPRGIREHNEHLSILHYPDLIPPTIVTRSQDRLRSFIREQDGAIVIKPVDGFGGLGIFLCKLGDPNLSSIFETATQGGRIWTMAQRYLPAASIGDKRIVLVDGEPIGGVLRVPPPDEIRDNLHVGGRAEKTEITAEDRAIIAAIRPMLLASGLILVGLDVIGGQLTEINITSPTGLRHIDRLDGINSAGLVLDGIERKIHQ